MMDETKHEARRIFTAALALATPEERGRYLDEVCRDKPELRQRVETLLRAHAQASGFLEQTVQVPPPSDLEIEGAGVMIGHYKLVEEIGEGGFGRVFMAEQKQPVHRKVALKIIKAGMDTKEVVARFEAERQALALMDHPNIAQVFDGGVTQAGRPYFVMELVRGISITEFCDQRGLSTEERLQLFIQVSRAVQHAHQKGIIHRDLKPSNILVTLVNGEPLPKIIDFGVAKALGQRLTDKTLFTGFLHLVGTPAYMSPEQAELSGVDIDTRADIYALGVLLYELLTGVTPFDSETLRNAALDEVRRMIRETDPPKPSTRLHAMGEKLSEVAHHRHVEPSALTRQVHGDLDWIVMKCLEKDRRRRYETPGALVEDIQRHLEHQPVVARPPATAYRTRKFIRRHRMGVTLAASVTLALVAGLVVSLIGFAKARRERDRAVQVEEEQRGILAFFVEKRLDDREMVPLLEEGARIAQDRLGSDSEAAIWFLQRLASRYGAMGEWSRALELYQRLIQLNPDDQQLWWSANVAAIAEGKVDISRELSAGMLARFGNSPDPWVAGQVGYMLLLSSDNPSHLKSAENLAGRAFRTGTRDAWSHIIAGVAAYRMTNYVEVETHMEQARTDPDPAAHCVGAYYMAMARQRRGETESARQLLKEGNQHFKDSLGASDLRDRWRTLCENIFIRAQAERLILGREISPPVTVETLAAAYQARKQVAGLLADGYSLAAKRKWTESANAYAAALQDPNLNWPEECRASFHACLPLQMGIAFVKAGDRASYERLCRLALAHLHESADPPEMNAGRFALLCFMDGKSLPQDLQQRGLELARIAAAHPVKHGYWGWYAAGMAESHAGNPGEAVKLLAPAEESNDLYCKGGAMVCRAMALKKLGRDSNAAQVLQQAEALLAEPTKLRSGGGWWDLEICQLALEHARQLIKAPSTP